MNDSGTVAKSKDTEQNDTHTIDPDDDAIMLDGENTLDQPHLLPAAKTSLGGETVTIKRTYKFAGEVITEEKVVPKESAEAWLYLSTPDSVTLTTTVIADQPKKP